MKKRLKDPRPILAIVAKFSIILFITLPYMYFNLKLKSIQNMLFLALTLIVLLILMIRSSYNKKDEYKLHNAIAVSYAFSGLWLLFGLLFLFAIIVDYIRHILPSINFIAIILIFLIYSFIIFYLANKSRKYERLR